MDGRKVWWNPLHLELLHKFNLSFLIPSFVLFCFVLFCFVLFCFVLFCFVLFCFVLFCFVFLFFLFFSFLFFSFLFFSFLFFSFLFFSFLFFSYNILFDCSEVQQEGSRILTPAAHHQITILYKQLFGGRGMVCASSFSNILDAEIKIER